ncbi:MAG: 2,3-bisphosphoglycerate-dependent phosphoglycerate mutase [Gammaproteobacteria bacterium]|nr:2,3-bisphosphoglycerate-dependent phosphoglycerate mutase [Gammaproteobacteria bacterium]
MKKLNRQQETTLNTCNQTPPLPVVMIRHAQSQWNLDNRFTGWADPPLTAAGIAEAKQAGENLREHGFRFDAAYSSRLERAIQTLDILLDALGQADIPRYQDWRLNERHYGQLQGLNKADMTAQVGEQQVWRWRRSYEEQATPLLRTDPTHPANNPKYADVDPALLPGVENLAQTRARVAAFWQDQIVPRLVKGERILISGHGNTLRALLMELAGMSVAEVESFEIPTATPILYEFDHHARPLEWRYLMREKAQKSA